MSWPSHEAAWFYEMLQITVLATTLPLQSAIVHREPGCTCEMRKTAQVAGGGGIQGVQLTLLRKFYEQKKTSAGSTTEYTKSGNGHFRAYIPSWW